MNLSSPAFSANSPIPARYTCDGENISPSLAISEIPSGAKSLALTMTDPDAPAGTWTHWLLFNLPPTTTVLPENTQGLGVSGTNSFGDQGYGGPCPPSGTHRYVFTLYALDSELSVTAGVDAHAALSALNNHILDNTELVGTYTKR